MELEEAERINQWDFSFHLQKRRGQQKTGVNERVPPAVIRQEADLVAAAAVEASVTKNGLLVPISHWPHRYILFFLYFTFSHFCLLLK